MTRRVLTVNSDDDDYTNNKDASAQDAMILSTNVQEYAHKKRRRSNSSQHKSKRVYIDLTRDNPRALESAQCDLQYVSMDAMCKIFEYTQLTPGLCSNQILQPGPVRILHRLRCTCRRIQAQVDIYLTRLKDDMQQEATIRIRTHLEQLSLLAPFQQLAAKLKICLAGEFVNMHVHNKIYSKYAISVYLPRVGAECERCLNVYMKEFFSTIRFEDSPEDTAIKCIYNAKVELTALKKHRSARSSYVNLKFIFTDEVDPATFIKQNHVGLYFPHYSDLNTVTMSNYLYHMASKYAIITADDD